MKTLTYKIIRYLCLKHQVGAKNKFIIIYNRLLEYYLKSYGQSIHFRNWGIDRYNQTYWFVPNLSGGSSVGWVLQITDLKSFRENKPLVTYLFKFPKRLPEGDASERSIF